MTPITDNTILPDAIICRLQSRNAAIQALRQYLTVQQAAMIVDKIASGQIPGIRLIEEPPCE